MLIPILQEHLDFYGLLTHIFLGDVTRWAVSEFERDEESQTLREMLEFMEARFTDTHEHEQEIIAVSFIENLPTSDEPNGRIRELLGPEMSKHAALVDSR